MYTDKKLLKFGLYAERAHRLAFDIALAAAELSQYGKGMAIIADEARNIGVKLHALISEEGGEASEEKLLDGLLQMKYLVTNGWLEVLRLHESQLILKKRIAVILDEIDTLVEDIQREFDLKSDLPLTVPRISARNKVVNLLNHMDTFLLFTIGGKVFCEAASNVLEIFLYPPEQQPENPGAEGVYVHIRGVKFPLLDYYKKLSAEKKGSQTVLIIRTEYEAEPKEYALLVDGRPQIFYSLLGEPAKPVDLPEEIVRECWNCQEDLQMRFLNYDLTLN